MSEAALAAGEVFLSQGNRTHLALCKEFQGKQTVSFVVHTQATVGLISRQEGSLFPRRWCASRGLKKLPGVCQILDV